MVAPGSIAIIINPISGTGPSVDTARRRVAHAVAFLGAHGGDPSSVFLTDRPGHARELATAAVGRGVDTVVAWGGDGTINEVGSAVAFSRTALAIVPSGSGNGLARELGLPFAPELALQVARTGSHRVIDAGEIDGHLFFNVAGIGLDARVAHRFAAEGLGRGLSRYAAITLRELLAYVPDHLTVTTPTSSITTPVLMVAVANGRQYGNGAVIAPRAVLDDGKLDIVVVTARSAASAMAAIPLLFLGQAARVRGVTMEAVDDAAVWSSTPRPVLYHRDGEPGSTTSRIRIRVHQHALRVKVP